MEASMAILKKTNTTAFEWETAGLSHSNTLAAGQSQTGAFYVDDLLVGGRGNDWLYGLGGDDMLFGEGGNDTLHGGAGADTMFGGNGIDTVSYAWSHAVSIGLGIHSAVGGDAEGDQIWEVENVIGSGDDDGIWGDAAANFLDGGKGDDYLSGEAGDDYLRGGDGDDSMTGFGDNDTLEGDAGSDQLWGGAGDDVLHGGSSGDILLGETGNDRLDGGTGVDSLTGGEGADTFVFYAELPDLKDVIEDFDPSQDILLLHDVSDANDPDVQVVTNDEGFAELHFSGGGGVVLEGVALGNVTTLAQVDAAINIEYVA
jgi:Ca2+-binding RTX toxin-like protein